MKVTTPEINGKSIKVKYPSRNLLSIFTARNIEVAKAKIEILITIHSNVIIRLEIVNIIPISEVIFETDSPIKNIVIEAIKSTGISFLIFTLLV